MQSKEKYPKKKPPHAALILRSEGFERGFSKGHPSPCEKRDASLHRPCGLIRPNPSVLGAAKGDQKTIPEFKVSVGPISAA